MFEFVTVAMDAFPLRWRFVGPQRGGMPSTDLERIAPADETSAHRIWKLRPHVPSGERTDFVLIKRTSIAVHDAGEIQGVQAWLRQTGVPPDRKVFASWDNRMAAWTRWDLIARYWNLFWHPASDDLFVFDLSGSWLLFLSHEEEAFFWAERGRTIF